MNLQDSASSLAVDTAQSTGSNFSVVVIVIMVIISYKHNYSYMRTARSGRASWGITHRRRGWQGGGITETLKCTEDTEYASVPSALSVFISGFSGSQPVLAPHLLYPFL
jgi:predicted membrane chloride channel (bestrophin family)